MPDSTEQRPLHIPRSVVRKQRKCWTCGEHHECYDISPDHGWRPWKGEGQPWYVQPPKGVVEACGGCGKPRMEHGFDAEPAVTERPVRPLSGGSPAECPDH